MTYEDLSSILDWIQTKSNFTDLAKALYCSIFSLSWTVWMRIGEVENLRYCDILHLSKRAEFGDFTEIRIPWRKTDQDGNGTLYELHDDLLNEPGVRTRQYLLQWVSIMKQQQAETTLNFTDDQEHVFPLLSSDSNSLQAGTKMDSYNINQVLQKCVEGLQLEGIDLLGRGGQYTLHCFRRGGAQHRFFECKKTWPLVAIKYWGGWSSNERMDTIVNYVLNEYENR
jgi:hypothetical protein